MIQSGLRSGRSVDPSNYVTISFTHPLDRDDVRYIVQTSTDLADWQADAILVSEIHNTADGTVTLTYRTAQPITAEQRRSVRLKIEMRVP